MEQVQIQIRKMDDRIDSTTEDLSTCAQQLTRVQARMAEDTEVLDQSALQEEKSRLQEEKSRLQEKERTLLEQHGTLLEQQGTLLETQKILAANATGDLLENRVDLLENRGAGCEAVNPHASVYLLSFLSWCCSCGSTSSLKISQTTSHMRLSKSCSGSLDLPLLTPPCIVQPSAQHVQASASTGGQCGRRRAFSAA